MFGYIKAYKPEMRIKEWEMYKAVYCSLCRQLGKKYGLFARFTLSYDFTFLALLEMSLKESSVETERKCCAFNPLKKCNYCKNTDNELNFASNAAALLLYYKLLDNIDDEKGIKKLGFLCLKPMFSSLFKKAEKENKELAEIFKAYTDSQKRVEKEKADIDLSADPTAVMLSNVFKMCSDNELDKRALERLGYCMGRYIYILDAAADLPKDLKKDNFNPFKSHKDYKEYAKTQLNICIEEMIKAFELINICKFKNILGNIIYLGLEDTVKKELEI